MTLDEIRRRVAAIRDASDDYEAAHWMEDCLFRDVLQAIALGECEFPAMAAHTALRSKDVDFERYCA